MRNLLIFCIFGVVGVYSIEELTYGPNAIACARKHNVTDDFFKVDFTKNNFTAELIRHADEVTRLCIGGCYVKKELNYVFKPQITADNLPSILEKANISESLLRNLRKCHKETHQNDCEFMGCFIGIFLAEAFVSALEKGISMWLGNFEIPQT